MKNIKKLRENSTRKVAKHLHNAGFTNERICAACEFNGSDACAIANDGCCEEGIYGWLENEAYA